MPSLPKGEAIGAKAIGLRRAPKVEARFFRLAFTSSLLLIFFGRPFVASAVVEPFRDLVWQSLGRIIPHSSEAVGVFTAAVSALAHGILCGFAARSRHSSSPAQRLCWVLA
jgi:hypothetical protein